MPVLEAIAHETAINVHVTRIVSADPTAVYRAWTNPENLKTWFGPSNMYCSTAQLDPHVGGEYKIGVRLLDAPADAPDAVATGNYTRVEADRLLQFTWKPTWMPGEESLVTVSLLPAPGGTEIAVRHEGFSSGDADQRYTEGWTGCLNKLHAELAA